MNPQNENNGNNGEIYSSSESLMVPEEKTPVSRDEKIVSDEYADYKFLKPVRGRHTADGAVKKHRDGRHKKKMKTWKKVLFIVVCSLLAIIIAAASTVFILIQSGRSQLFLSDVKITLPDISTLITEDNGKYVTYNGHKYKYNENVTNLLFMGVDKRDLDESNEEGTGGQADVLVMMAIDTQKRKISLISLPRDTVADVDVYDNAGNYTGMQQMQVCLAYAYGDGKEKSCENTLAAIRRIFYNVPVPTYYALDLDGIAPLNDSVGGVDVVAPESIYKFEQGQSYHLEGKDAEAFVRTRSHEYTEANLSRMERQKVYAKAFIDKVFTTAKQDLSVPVNMFNESSPYSCTNLNASKVAYLAKEAVLGGGMDVEMVSVQGSMTRQDSANQEDSVASYHLDEKQFYELFLNVYYDQIS